MALFKNKNNAKNPKPQKKLPMKVNVSADEYINMEPEEAAAAIAEETSAEALITVTEDIDAEINYLTSVVDEMNGKIEELGGIPTVMRNNPDPNTNMDTSDLVDPDFEKEDEDETVSSLETAKIRTIANTKKTAVTRKQLSNDEWLAMAPDKSGAEAYLTVQKKSKAYKDSLIATILTNSKSGWTQDELNPMNMTQLEKIVDGMGAKMPPDYGIRGMQIATNKEEGVELQIDAFAKRTKEAK